MADEKGMQQQILSNRLRAAVVDIDLQLYKGSIYKLRWGSPGGLDAATPCYRAAKRAVDETPWPDEMNDLAKNLAAQVEQYIATLETRDVTSASAQHSVMMSHFEALKDSVLNWT